MDRRRYIADKLIEAITIAVQDNGRKIFDKAQSKVPTRRGGLKSSGSFNLNHRGWIIQYTKDYAQNVELGRAEEQIVGTFTYSISGHVRSGFKRKNGTYVSPTRVKSYNSTAVNQKRIGIQTPDGPIFRTISKWKARAGRFFLRSAIEEGLKELPSDLKIRIAQIRL